MVVLGHHDCGALAAATAVADGAPTPDGALGDVVTSLVPAVTRARDQGADDPHRVSEHHAAATAGLLVRASPVIRTAHGHGALGVLAATYALTDGRTTTAMGPHALVNHLPAPATALLGDR